MIAHLDCSTGVSGDKFLGALLDAGESDGAFTAGDLQAALSRMVPDASVTAEKVLSHGTAAVSVRVEGGGHQPVRTLDDVNDLIGRASLPESVRDRSMRAFGLLARAEARVHGCPVEKVHFHEVGALDSILDVIGVFLGLEMLGVEHLTASPLALGRGSVDTAHGVLPVPAPATLELLVGVPVRSEAEPAGAQSTELTTPTGALLVRVAVDEFGHSPAMVVRRTGHGAGTRDIGLPNVCRLVIGEPAESPELTAEKITLLETNVDHISGEAIGFAAEQLLAEGALDVWVRPALMKKGRPAYVLALLVTPETAEKFAARTVALTGSLGVRRFDSERYVASRTTEVVETPYGAVRFKSGPGGARPEADDVALIARTTGRSFDSVAAELQASRTASEEVADDLDR